MPFLILDGVWQPANRPTQAILYLSALLVGLSWQVGPLLEFFRSVSPELSLALPSMSTFLTPWMNPASAANVLRSCFAGAALLWTYSNVLQRSREQWEKAWDGHDLVGQPALPADGVAARRRRLLQKAG